MLEPIRSYPWLTPLVALVALVVLTLVERARPLRPISEPKRRRVLRNLATGALADVVGVPARALVVVPLALLVERRGWGLLHVVDLPVWVALPLGLVLLDYTLWHWHRLNHRVPFLWRFHSAHHADLEMDASTALRFHFGEIALGIGWMIVQVLVLGTGPLTLAVFSAVLMASVLFHHSNVRLPEPFERRLVRVVTTPRMHGIHHSVVADETNSNFSSLLTAWDRLHRTLRLDVPQERITIGVREWRDPRELTFLGVQLIPFRAKAAPAVPSNATDEHRGRHRLTPGGPRPYFAEVPYFVWGEVNYDSEGDCRGPRDREWTSLELEHRDTHERVTISIDDEAWDVEGHEPAASRAALFLCRRSGARSVSELSVVVEGDDWNADEASARAAAVAQEFERPELDPFDSHVFWGSWKWIGWFGTEFTWTGRWIMHSLVRRDARAVMLCIEWLRHGTAVPEQGTALRAALATLTAERFDTDREWIRWYDTPDRRARYPEPDFDAWLADLKSQPPEGTTRGGP